MTELKEKTLQFAEAGCQTIMKKFLPEELPPAGLFHYHQGVFLSGMEGTYLHTMNKEYADYIKAYVDSLIDADGNIVNYVKERLDDLQPGILLFRLLEETGDKRYEKAIKTIIGHLKEWPCNSVGGFWHKFNLENQMWLDGLYMAGQFMCMYADKYNDDEVMETACRQALLMWEHCRSKKGLMHHAWDENKECEWADKETGLAPEVWGRAAGWYIVALTIMLEYIPRDNKYREELENIVRDYCTVIAKYQDSDTGCWYQVVDKGHKADNWIESSGSALFVCGMAKALRGGYLEEKFNVIVENGLKGVLNMVEKKEDGTISIPKICVGTGVSDYEYYINRPTCENDLHGMGAFLLMCNECYSLCDERNE